MYNQPLYPLAHVPTDDELNDLAFHSKHPCQVQDVQAIWSGKTRPPKKGEWFLSGNPLRAYVAQRDLSDRHFIASLAQVTTITVKVDKILAVIGDHL